MYLYQSFHFWSLLYLVLTSVSYYYNIVVGFSPVVDHYCFCSKKKKKKKKKKFLFFQISVFVRGQKMSSELIHLLLDKTMARPQPRNRQTNPPNRPTKCKTVFVDSQRRNAAGRTLTQSDKDSVLKIPSNGMQNLSSVNSVAHYTDLCFAIC